jgi:hypothetical protein
MVAKRIPSQVRQDTMVLMTVITVMSEYNVWLKPLERLQIVFDRFTLVGEKASPEIFDQNCAASRPAQEFPRTAPGFADARPIRTEHHPHHFETPARCREFEDCASATNLNIVTVRPQTKDALFA